MADNEGTTGDGVLADSATVSSVDFATDALLKKWNVDAEEPSNPTGTETPDTSKAESDSETQETREDPEDDLEFEDDPKDDDDSTETEDSQEKKVLADDHEVEISVDGENRRVSVKDLKRLYGQEAALTRKSQEVAHQRKEASETLQRHAAGLDALMKRAQERFEPYSKIDMLVASRTMDPEDFAQLRREAQVAYEDVQFLQTEVDTFLKSQQEAQQQQLLERAKEAVKVLQEEIPNWSPEVYNEIRNYAVQTGIPVDVVNNLVDPTVIKLINKARMYDKAKELAKSKKAKAPTNVTKPTRASSQTEVGRDRGRAAVERMKSTGGDIEGAADAFLARWGVTE